ncbi:APC family permease [Anaerovorax odorimutans]|uniref:APC family permease n=1 Tax=Anaerovorax odorimutans TaxID=109327 RepID=UPI000426D0C5|nr:APC family permease [Anaerovorax odorimutans]
MADLNQTHGVAGLKKYDMKVSGIVFMIYCLVAAGAFGIEEMIPASGPGLTLVMLIIFPIIWALPISNLVAEMGSILPSEGGVYVWVREAFGEFWGFQAGWWATISTYITNGVYVALVVGYTSQFVPMSEATAFLLKIIMIAIFTIINLMGIREVGKVSTILSILIILAFAAVALVGFMNWNYNPAIPFIPEDMTLLESIGGCIGICIWMYCGYECISNMAGEVKNPQVIPKGLIIAMPLIALTYVLPTMGGIASIGQWENWSTDGAVGYAAVLTENLGHVWGYVFLFVAIISQCAIFNTYLASGSRGFFVLADDNLCPEFLVKVSKGRGVPYVGILSLSIVTMFLAQYDFTTLVMTEVVFMLALYIIMPLAVIKLRKTIPISEREGCFIIPWGKTGLYLFAGLPVVISVIALLINGTDYFLIGLLATSTGPIFYILFKIKFGGLYKNDPILYPVNLKTKLAVGDTLRISLYCMIAGIFAVVGHFFLIWYEGDWGEEYYLEEYESGLFSNFQQMIDSLLIGGLIVFSIGIILYIIGKKVEPEK